MSHAAIVRKPRTVYGTDYRLVFYPPDNGPGTWAIPCTAEGVPTNPVQAAATLSHLMAQGVPLLPELVESRTRSNVPGILRCVCGAAFNYSGRTDAECPSCDRLYNACGALLDQHAARCSICAHGGDCNKGEEN